MRSAFEGPEEEDDGTASNTTSVAKTAVADNVPLALHACAPMAAMLACGISQDPVMARRTIKTLVSGDSGTSKNTSKDSNASGVALTSLPPRPPASSGHQEYVGTCKLAARLAALAELQLATVSSDNYAWWSTDSVVTESYISGGSDVLVNVHAGMRSALNKSLRPHLPVLCEHWLAMLRDQVSLRARARAVLNRRSSMSSGAMYVIPAPRHSLLEHNEDSGQAEPIFDTMWPQVVQAVSSLVGTSMWTSGERYQQQYAFGAGCMLTIYVKWPTKHSWYGSNVEKWKFVQCVVKYFFATFRECVGCFSSPRDTIAYRHAVHECSSMVHVC
jgi:hypothetical protein